MIRDVVRQGALMASPADPHGSGRESEAVVQEPASVRMRFDDRPLPSESMT